MLTSYLRCVCVVLLLAAVGCESSSKTGGGGNMSMDDLAKQVEGKPKSATPPAAPANATPAAPTTPTTTAVTPPSRDAAAGAETANSSNSAVPANATVAGDQGPQRTQGGYMGAVIAANRSVRERVGGWPWKESMKLYNASNGHLPRNTKEFLDYVHAEGTPLPELPAGMTYFYEPKGGEADYGELWQVPIEEAQSSQPGTGR